MPSLSFHKSERLHHKTLIDLLFRKGVGAFCHPFRAVWMLIDDKTLNDAFKLGKPKGIGPVQIMVTVPKKRRRRAVDRVLMRRRIKEAYRLNRLPLKEKIISSHPGHTLLISFIYTSDENLPYSKIEGRMLRILNKISDQIPVQERTLSK